MKINKIDYCTGKQRGYLCVEGVKSAYFECSSPHYTGWRECSVGTQCQVVGFHTDNPCSAVIGREGESGINDDDENAHSQYTFSWHYSSFVDKNTILESLSWWNWLFIGVGLFMVICVVVSVAIGISMHLKERRRLRKTLSESQILEIKEMARRDKEEKLRKKFDNAINTNGFQLQTDREKRIQTIPIPQNINQFDDFNTI